MVPTRGQLVWMTMSPAKPESLTYRLDSCAAPIDMRAPTGPHDTAPEMAPNCPLCEYVPLIWHAVSTPVLQRSRTPAGSAPSAAMLIESCSAPAGVNISMGVQGGGGHGRGATLRTSPAEYCP